MFLLKEYGEVFAAVVGPEEEVPSSGCLRLYSACFKLGWARHNYTQ